MVKVMKKHNGQNGSSDNDDTNDSNIPMMLTATRRMIVRINQNTNST